MRGFVITFVVLNGIALLSDIDDLRKGKFPILRDPKTASRLHFEIWMETVILVWGLLALGVFH